MQSIRASDFRIGNTVLSNGHYYKITSKDLQWIEQIEQVPEDSTELYCPILLSERLLRTEGYTFDLSTGHYWKSFNDQHLIELLHMDENQWFPILIGVPEMSHESEQRVYLPDITYLHELENITWMICR